MKILVKGIRIELTHTYIHGIVFFFISLEVK